jgi:hypothetical protein
MLLDIPIKPILALDFTSLMAIFFVLFSVFGFISNLLKKLGGDDQPQVRGRQPRRQQGELQGEIDDFLKEVLGGKAPQEVKKKPRPRPQRKQQIRGEHEADKVPERRRFEESQASVEAPPERRQQPRSQSTQRRKLQKTQRRPATKAASPVFDEETKNKSLKDRHIKSTVDSHVDRYMQSHLDENRDEGVLTSQDSPIVASSLLDGELDEHQQDANFAAELRHLLASPSGMRQMIVANEILSKPKSLR